MAQNGRMRINDVCIYQMISHESKSTLLPINFCFANETSLRTYTHRWTTKKHNIDLGAGYPCFVISIAAIGVCTAVIGDVAGHLGCFIYLKDSVNAIAFVALGTSVPGKNIKEYNLQKEAFNAVS